MTIKKLTASTVALSLMLAACSQGAGQPGALGNGSTGSFLGSGMGGGEALGTLAGAGLGGYAGSNIGHGSGKLAATAIGVLAGGFLGNRIGNSLDKGSVAYANQQTQVALNNNQPGQALPWQSPTNPQVQGTIVPQQVYQGANGQYCREYTTRILVGGQWQSGVGQACRNPDGSWTPSS